MGYLSKTGGGNQENGIAVKRMNGGEKQSGTGCRLMKIQSGMPPLCLSPKVRSGRRDGVVAWKVTDVPNEVGDDEVLLRFSKTLLWVMEEAEAYEFSYGRLEAANGVLLPSYDQLIGCLIKREGLKNKTAAVESICWSLGVGARTVWTWLKEPESRTVVYCLVALLMNGRMRCERGVEKGGCFQG